MLSGRLKKLAEEYNLTTEKDLAYGVMAGYMFTFAEKAGPMISIAAFFEEDEAEQDFIEAIKSQKSVTELIHKEYGFSIGFKDSVGVIKRVRAFMEWLLPVLAVSGARGADYCPMCHKALLGDSVDVYFRDMACRPHQSCLHQLMLEADMADEQARWESKNVGRGALGAFLGGLAGTIPWIAGYYAGWFVGWFGLLIGAAANWGYKKAGGKPCKAKVTVVIAAVLVNVLLSFMLGVALSFAVMIIKGEMSYTLAAVPILTLLYMMDGEFLMEMLPDVVMGLVFAMMGCASIFSELKNEAQGQAAQIRMLGQ